MLDGQQAIKTTHLAKGTLYNTLQFSRRDEGLWEDLTTGERKKYLAMFLQRGYLV
jgi:hypothetical protein